MRPPMIRPLLRLSWLVLLALSLPAWAESLVAPQELARQLREHVPPALILDTRTAEEYARGHVPGARLLPHDELEAQLASLAPFRDAQIVLYCRSGRRSREAEAVLREHGFTRLAQLDGSWLAWEAEGLPAARIDAADAKGARQ